MSYAGERAPATSLGLLDATMVGVGAMIGAGIFVLTGLAAETAGPGAIVVFALNGGVTTFTALSYAELAAAIPRNGGGYAYVREAFPASVAFVMGWTRSGCRGSLIVADAEGSRIGGPETVLEAGERYVVAFESDVAEEVMNLLRG